MLVARYPNTVLLCVSELFTSQLEFHWSGASGPYGTVQYSLLPSRQTKIVKRHNLPNFSCPESSNSSHFDLLCQFPGKRTEQHLLLLSLETIMTNPAGNNTAVQ